MCCCCSLLLVASDSDVELKDGIASFYDKSSSVWEDIWGEHMHHGYYVDGFKPKGIEDHRYVYIARDDDHTVEHCRTAARAFFFCFFFVGPILFLMDFMYVGKSVCIL